MFVLDSNVLSDIMKPAPSPEVAAWLACQPIQALFTAAVWGEAPVEGAGYFPWADAWSQVTFGFMSANGPCGFSFQAHTCNS
jgi:hypothetical protein